jgi:hypothetical protein
MKDFASLKIFHTFVMMEKWEPVRDAIHKMVLEILMGKLEPHQQEMLAVKNYHFWDPNFPDKGRTQGLLEHLIFDALSISSFKNTDHFYSQMNLNDLKKFTGVSDLKEFKEEIEDINRRWNGLAWIKIIGDFKGNPEISFNLF